MSVAYWISPDGKIIDVKTKHINTVIENPEKFGFNKEAIEFMYDTYGEKIGQEGKAREQILISLFNKEWIRIRKYKTFWSVNVIRLAGKNKSFITQWAQKILKGLHGFKEVDKFIPVKIDQKGQTIKTIELGKMAESDKFIAENTLIECDIKDLKDIKLYDSVIRILNKRKTFKMFLEGI